MTKFVTAQEAVQVIQNEMTVAVGGFNGFGAPDELILALRDRFLETGSPRDLTLMKSVSVGDRGERGVNQIALEGLIRTVITSHVGLEPAMAKLIEENKCLAYMVPPRHHDGALPGGGSGTQRRADPCGAGDLRGSETGGRQGQRSDQDPRARRSPRSSRCRARRASSTPRSRWTCV